MNHDEREERALDALTASFYHINPDDDPDPLDDPEILDEADRRALAALGEDLVDRLLTGGLNQAPVAAVPEPPPWNSIAE